MAKIWALITMLLEIWNALKAALGLIKKAQHEGEIHKIDEAAEKAGDPNLSLEERLKAGAELEHQQNKHT